jgi:hypothetical protein
MPRGDDEHMTLPTWRVRQLQDIEDAAREAVELVLPSKQGRTDTEARVHDLLTDALEGRQ